MHYDLNHACDVTGFVPQHAIACQSVADRMNTIISFREPGKAARSLIADNYAMKGFRIDTKSCNWGPMSGFVCADPRLSKPDGKNSFAAKNAAWTAEAIEGHIKHEWFGNPTGPDVDAWKADVMPIVISKKRVAELGLTYRSTPQGHLIGESVQTFGDATGVVRLPWRLVPTLGASNPWLKAPGARLSDYYALCVEPRAGFKQAYPHGVAPILFRGYETILGLINPGTRELGFKACVTADYDLFAIWAPSMAKDDAVGSRHMVNAQIASAMRVVNAHGQAQHLKPSRMINGQLPSMAPFGAPPRAIPGGVARLAAADTPPSQAGMKENYRYGDVSARVMQCKVALNSAIIAQGGYRGGNAIHHNAEVANLKLAKDSLEACLPIIVFVPNAGTALVASRADFIQLVGYAKVKRYLVIAKDSWLKGAA